MSGRLAITSDNLRDPSMFATDLEVLTVLGASMKPLEQYPEKVFDEPVEEGQLPIGANEPEVLHSMKATIFEVTLDCVRLKMVDDVYVNVPKIVFSGKEATLRYGQSVVYSIKRRVNGFRFQDVDIDSEAAENPYKQRVSDLLASIPQRS